MSEERSIGAEALNEGLGFISLYAMSFKIVKQDTALGRGNFIPGYVVLYDGRFDEFFRYQATAERYVERRKEELSRDSSATSSACGAGPLLDDFVEVGDDMPHVGRLSDRAFPGGDPSGHILELAGFHAGGHPAFSS